MCWLTDRLTDRQTDICISWAAFAAENHTTPRFKEFSYVFYEWSLNCFYSPGAVGVGSNMVAQSMCLGPVYCRTGSGQCCLIVLAGNGPRCPQSC